MFDASLLQTEYSHSRQEIDHVIYSGFSVKMQDVCGDLAVLLKVLL